MQERASGDDEVRDLGSHRILHAQTETCPGTEAPDGAVTPDAGWRQTPTRGPVHVEAGSATDVGVFPQALGR